jgi:signal transduction histidine kinase/DNA-binding response OmpR family regulator
MASEEIALIVTEQFARVLEVPECSLAMLYSDENGNALRVLGAYGSANHPKQNRLNTSYFLADQPIVHKAVQSLQPVVAQAGDDTLSKDAQHYLRKHGIQTLLAIPLAVKGEAIGVIELTSHQWPRYYSADQLNLAMTLANAAAVALENARLYEDQRQTAERLQEVDHLKTQFLANMSHELRTPLNSIIGFSRVILKGIDGPTTDLQQQDLTAIYSSGQHLLSLINDILDLSKIEAGKMELAIEEVDLNDMINSVMSTAVGLTKEKPIELERNVEPDLPLVQVDRTRIRQVLINLISNAAKFTDEGFIRVSAHLQKDASSNPEIWIGVTDSGPGIEIDDQDKLFKAFSQVDASPTRKSGGTGLGLSISRHLVELHKGQIGVESEPGQGSTFFFTLPLPNTEHFELPTLNIDGPVILSIDDNRQVISLYERYLGNHNYHVYPLTEPEMAIQLARQMQPFAITLDIMMPGQDGWSILQQLKQDPETRNIPVIICSILEDQDKGFSLGAADYLVKPILEEDLVHSIRRINQDDSIHKILVVDDDADDLRLVQKILEQEGNYIVELAQGGQEALVRLEEEPPHAIILDLYMPGLDGFSLLDTVRANPRIRDIPVIIFSGGDLDEDQRKKLAQAGQEILQKSLFTEDELLSTLERSLRRFAQSNQTPVL